MGLTAATYLGPNTGPILRGLTRYLRVTTGLDIEADVSPRTSEQALEGSEPLGHLTWACGHLTAELLGSGSNKSEVLDIVATPVFVGEQGPTYHSVIVVRHDGPRDLRSAMSTRLGVNEEESWSGHLGLVAHVRASSIADWFDQVTITGSHVDSIAALVEGEVDVISVDHTVWAATTREGSIREADLAGLRVLERTMDWPAPPFSVRSDVERDVREELVEALIALPRGEVDGLEEIRRSTRSNYAAMSDPFG